MTCSTVLMMMTVFTESFVMMVAVFTEPFANRPFHCRYSKVWRPCFNIQTNKVEPGPAIGSSPPPKPGRWAPKVQ